jgi:hypothetical protein
MCLRTLDIFKSFVIHIKSYVVFFNLNPEDGGSIFIWNVGLYLKVYKALAPKRPLRTFLLPWDQHLSSISILIL